MSLAITVTDLDRSISRSLTYENFISTAFRRIAKWRSCIWVDYWDDPGLVRIAFRYNDSWFSHSLPRTPLNQAACTRYRYLFEGVSTSVTGDETIVLDAPDKFVMTFGTLSLVGEPTWSLR